MIDEQTVTDKLRLCAACPKMCRHVCPTFFAWRSDSPTPHSRALLIYQQMTGVRQLDERAVEVLYQCLECSHCLTWCLPQVDIATIVETVRRQLVNDGRHPPRLDELVTAVRRHHNPFGEPHSARADWFRSDMRQHSTAGTSSRLIYFVGCTSSYRETAIAKSTADLLIDELGLDVLLLDDEWCCGSPLLRTGLVEASRELAHHNVEALNSMSGDLILTTCPGCHRTLTQDYPSLGLVLNKPVLHLSQFLASRLDSLPTLDLDGMVTYHDPCHLGRHCKIYDEPRAVIQRVTSGRLIEMQRNRENATCCGNGAGLRVLFPDQAKTIGNERLRHAKMAGASYLITACPFCKNMLNSLADSNITVLDLSELVCRAK